MALMAVWTFVHILSMFCALVLTLGPLFVMGARARRSDAPAVAAMLRDRKGLRCAAAPLFLLGILAGGMAQGLIGVDELVPWLAATVVRIVLYGIWDGLITAPWLKRLELAFASPEPADKEVLPALLRSPRPHLGAWGGVAVVAAMQLSMALTPSFGF